jgi:hypothetical protein
MDTLNALIKHLQNGIETGPSNTWVNKEDTFFYEIGREQTDGSITGIVQKFIPVTNFARRFGNFKINSDGTIVRFPGTSKKDWKIAEVDAYKEQLKTFPLR